ncbi:MAG: flagellar basal body L-ring protein FlgH [Nitrospirae bacterium]|nr:flagellar basal body L-ring protein FlgH [Candidatus Manganitrophaceae bacterium]
MQVEAKAMGRRSGFIGVGMFLSLLGCSTPANQVKPSEISPAYLHPADLHQSDGSLWAADQSRTFFFQDTKASHIGDIVTVHIVENAKGTKDAATKSGRTSTLAASTSALLGLPTSRVQRLQADANFADTFDGSGSTSRSGALTADLTAVVTAVFPNGNMAIEGKREVLINSEKELISLSGVIRPDDIGAKNTILSTFISEAKIEYSGSGVLNDKQRPGWLMRILDWIWPF